MYNGTREHVEQPQESQSYHEIPPHPEIRDKLESYAAGMLDDVEWLAVRTHIAECAPCHAALFRPEIWSAKPPPRRITPPKRGRADRPDRPGWPIVFGTALVSALVAFALGYALGIG